MPGSRLRWIIFLLLLAVCAVAWYWTGSAAGASFTSPGPSSKLTNRERALAIARSLSGLADTPEERQLDSQAAKLADQSMDLGFEQQLQQVSQQPQARGPEWRRLKNAENNIAVTQSELNQVLQVMQKASVAQRPALGARQQLLQAHLGLEQARLADARQDLLRSEIGGAAAIARAHKAAHAAVDQVSAQFRNRFLARNAARNPSTAVGLAGLIESWRLLGQKEKVLAWAGNWTRHEAAHLLASHQRLHARLDSQRQHRNQALAQARGMLAASRLTPAAHAAMLSALRLEHSAASSQRRLSEFDQRYQRMQQIAGIYQHWLAIALSERYLALHRFLGDLLYLLIGLGALAIAGGLLTSGISRRRQEARRLRTLRHLLRFTLYVTGLIWGLILIFGRPTQLVAILGLAGAGLTVALQDMLLSLCGWFVLIGRHGLSPGDWVEIDGVVGEVAEIGLLRTVLLETGNWTEVGHPTGRRVFFPNSYVFSGHYFNFTTSGQWLWDELQVQLPAGWEPHRAIAGVAERVRRETEAETLAAEAEWRKQPHAPADAGGVAFTPNVQIKPTASGACLSVRYITTAAHRSQLRSRLYHYIYEFFGEQPAAARAENALNAAAQS